MGDKTWMVNKHKIKKIIGILCIFFITFLIYNKTSPGRAWANHFILLANSFLNGKVYVQATAPWLEQVPIDANNFYVPYPPMPAILSMFPVSIFGITFHQEIISQLLGAGTTVLLVFISIRIKKDIKIQIWTYFLSAFGNIIWFLASVGSSWYLGQVSGVFFLTAALYESLNKKRPILVGIMLGAAYLSRIEIALSFPFFLYVFSGKKWFQNYLKVSLAALPFLLFNFAYNFVRFGVIWDKAYQLIPGVSSEPWFQHGLVNPMYIPNHLKIFFLGLPKFIKGFPFVTPTWTGLAIWFTTPAFLYALSAKLKDKIVKFSWISILLISLLIFSHGSTGFTQFGYRFAVDFYPILIFLTVKGVATTGLKWHHWLLLFLSVIVNSWGVILNKFGLIS